MSMTYPNDEPIKKPASILALFDDGGKTVDRYTIVFNWKPAGNGEKDQWDMLALGNDVTTPAGFSQWTSGVYLKDNAHLGKEITWEDLSLIHQKHIIMRLQEGD